MRFLPRLNRTRRLMLAGAAMLVAAGVLLVALAPETRLPVPMTASTDPDAPRLEYVRSLPDAGDDDLIRPVGVAVGNSRLYVSDSEAGVVRVFSTRGRDRGEIGRGVLDVPAYLAADEATGTLLVADRALGAVLRFSSDGEPVGELRPSTELTATWAPLGIAADGRGTVAVSDTAVAHRVLVMSRAGAVRLRIGDVPEAGPGVVDLALDYPNSLALIDDEIWVSDSNHRRVLIFERDGRLRRIVQLEGVTRGLAFLEGGQTGKTYVAVVDALASDIVLLDAEGSEVARYGAPGEGAGRLAYPNDVAFDPVTSQLFVADTGNARVQMWSVNWPGDSMGGVMRGLRLAPAQLFGLAMALIGFIAAAAILLFKKR